MALRRGTRASRAREIHGRGRTKAEVVKLRDFGGLSFEEVAEVLNVSISTANRWWAYSRA
jgi:DNA-directed RNA polymerase specialized sigma24 family protein